MKKLLAILAMVFISMVAFSGTKIIPDGFNSPFFISHDGNNTSIDDYSVVVTPTFADVVNAEGVIMIMFDYPIKFTNFNYKNLDGDVNILYCGDNESRYIYGVVFKYSGASSDGNIGIEYIADQTYNEYLDSISTKSYDKGYEDATAVVAIESYNNGYGDGYDVGYDEATSIVTDSLYNIFVTTFNDSLEYNAGYEAGYLDGGDNTSSITLSARNMGVDVYPNPVNSNVAFDINCGNFKQAQLISSTGKLIGTYNTQSISTDNLPSGLYLVNVWDNSDNMCVVKLLIR